MLRKSARKEIGKLLALILPDDDEAPRRDLAVIGGPHRDGQDSLELGLGWSWFDQLPGPAGATRFEE
jgi:hypothetical protein